MRVRMRFPVIELWAWFQASPAKRRKLRDRLLEGMREVGTLLIAFAPLDAVLVTTPETRGTLLRFLAVGCFLFVLALAVEWRGDQ